MLGRTLTSLTTALATLTIMLGASVRPLLAQDFSITSTALSPALITAGATAICTVTVTPSSGFKSQVTLTASCTAGAMTCTFSPESVTPNGSGVTSELTIVPTTSAPVSSTVTITGVSGDKSHTTSVVLTVQPPGTAAGAAATSTSDTLKRDFGFGVALGVTTKVKGANIVTSAVIDASGVVRVNTRANTTAGFMLETHYYVYPRPKKAALDGGTDDRPWGVGPFVAVLPGTSPLIQAVGGGLMLGFRRPKGTTPSGFGLGVGYEAIPAAQVLGSEFVDRQPAPKGPNGMPLPIRYETEDKGALLLILSVNF